MSGPSVHLKPLLLAGGRSTRLGSPKHMLSMPDGRLLYQRQIDLLHQSCPESRDVYLSVARDSALDPALQQAVDGYHVHEKGASTFAEIRALGITIIYDLEYNEKAESAGPAAGLMAAYEYDPTATWMVVACDYPLLTLDMLKQLRFSYEAPITCFRNPDGFCEPLLAIWGSRALETLAENVKCGRAGPTSVVRQLNGRMLDAKDASDKWFLNVNTQVEWNTVLATMGKV